MVIRSPFKDFYDIALQYGRDDDILYIRTKREVAQTVPGFRSQVLSRYYGRRGSFGNYLCDSFTIGFCGRLYFGFIAQLDTHSSFCYSIEDFDKFVDKYFDKAGKSIYFDERKKWRGLRSAREDYIQVFNRLSEVKDRYLNLFLEWQTPQFVATFPNRVTHVVINECLKDYQFYRIFDPYTAYQEVSMFMGGVLPQAGKHVPIPSDKDMLEIKGFDPKWSFRKEPSKKKG